MDIQGITQFLLEHKMWLAVLAPFVIGFIVIKIVG